MKKEQLQQAEQIINKINKLLILKQYPNNFQLDKFCERFGIYLNHQWYGYEFHSHLHVKTIKRKTFLLILWIIYLFLYCSPTTIIDYDIKVTINWLLLYQKIVRYLWWRKIKFIS